MRSSLLRVEDIPPLPSGEVAPKARVRGYAFSWEPRPLTRRFAPTSPRWGEVMDATILL
jgi:hypothetical protein